MGYLNPHGSAYKTVKGLMNNEGFFSTAPSRSGSRVKVWFIRNFKPNLTASSSGIVRIPPI